jgi:alkaline phosphatase D
MDQWPGYAHERMELVRFLADRKISNPVVLTGDIHSNWANELRVDDRQHDSKVVASEFVCTSISSGGNGPKSLIGLDQMKAANPAVKFFNSNRGYVRCVVTPQSWKTDYVEVADVLVADSPVTTSASFVVEAGSPLINKG